MQTPKRPRHVPSPAALRFLTQLAYISSGTALGVATLCAEERRRRIKTLQRIADNARVLRSHPRHVGNVASAAARAGQEDFGDGEWIAQMSGQDGSEGRRKRRRGKKEEEDERGAMAPDLPSVVEKGYERAIRSESRDVGKSDGFELLESRDVEYAPFTKHGTGSKTVAPGWYDVRPAQSGSAEVKPSKPENSNGKRSSLSAVKTGRSDMDAMRLSWTERTYKRTARRDGVSVRSAKGTTGTDRPMNATSELPSSTHSNIRAGSDEWLKASTSQHSRRITQEIDHFLAQHSSAQGSGTASADQIKLANHHLDRAISNGSLEDLHSLCLWKLNTGSMTSDDFVLLARSTSTLADRLTQQETIEFSVRMLRTDAFNSLDADVRFECKCRFLADAATRYERAEMLRLMVLVIRPETKDVESQSIRNRVESIVHALLRDGDSARVGQLFLLLSTIPEMLMTSSDWDQLSGIAALLITRCLVEEHISLATRLLQRFYHKIAASDPALANTQLHDSVKACGNRRMYPPLRRMLLYMYGRKEEPWDFAARLDDEGKLIIATAFSNSTEKTRHRFIFETMYKLLPRDDRRVLIESTRIKAIRDNWESTRNLQAAESGSFSLRQWLIENGDNQSLRQLDREMLDIYLLAGEVHMALGILTRIRGADLNSETVSLTALVLAKKEAWDGVQNLQDFAKQHKLLKWDFETTGIWDKIIHLYTLRHTPSESQAFVRDLVDRLGFRPYSATTKTILRCCIEHRALDVIPGWIQYVKSVGSDFELNSDVAARMFTAFWNHGRPGRRMKHRSIMWHCYFLQQCIPSFNLQSFKDLLKESIGYDLRNRFEQDLSTKDPRRNVISRLELVDQAVDVLPTPDMSVQLDNVAHEGGLTDGNMTEREVDAQSNLPVASGNEVNDSAIQEEKVDLPTDLGQQNVIERSLEGQNSNAGYEFGNHSQTVDEEKISSDREDQTASHAHATKSVPGNAANESKVNHTQFGFDLPSEVPIVEQGVDLQFHDAMNTFQPKETRADVHLDRFQDAVSSELDEWKANVGEDGDEIQPLDRQDDIIDFQSRLDADEGDFNSIDAFLSVEKIQQTTLERSMIKAMSLRDYQRVLELYESSLDHGRVPTTPRSLEVALQASVRLRGDDGFEAEQILDRAREAGMDVSYVAGPLIIQRMRSAKGMRKGDANKLRMMTIDYYRSNDTKGRPISHHIATTAAHQLIVHGAPEHGINLLAAVFNSEWAAKRPLDTATMTVFLHGYIKIRSIEGVQWVVQHMLSNDLWISRRFMRELKQTFNPPHDPYWASRFTRWPAEQEARLREWADVCYKRRIEQIGQDFKMGVQLRWMIKRCVKEQGWEVNADYDAAKKELEWAELGPEEVDLEWLRPQERDFAEQPVSQKKAVAPTVDSVARSKHDLHAGHGSNAKLVETASG